MSMWIIDFIKCCKKGRHVKKKYSKEELKDNRETQWNIYGIKEIGEGKKLYVRVHYYFKMKFLYPLIFIAKTIYKNDLDSPITNSEYDANMRIFSDSYDETVLNWHKWFIPNSRSYTGKNGPVPKPDNSLFVIKKLFLKLVYNDTAYREFLNIFCHTLARRMLEEYSGKNVKHLFYSDKSIYNVNYFLLVEQLKDVDWSKPVTLHVKKVKK